MRRLLNVPTLFAFALLLAFAAGTSAHAQGLAPGGFDPAQIEEMTASARQVPLTEDKVDRLIASFPDMRATGSEFPGTQLPEKAPAPASAQIASDLHVSYKTIANTCSQLKTKLGVHSLPELMRIAIEYLPSVPSRALKD